MAAGKQGGESRHDALVLGIWERRADVYWEPSCNVRSVSLYPLGCLPSLHRQHDIMVCWWALDIADVRVCMIHSSLLTCAELKLIVAGIYTNYTTKIVDDRDIEQPDAYTAGPKGNKLILRFDRLE